MLVSERERPQGRDGTCMGLQGCKECFFSAKCTCDWAGVGFNCAARDFQASEACGGLSGLACLQRANGAVGCQQGVREVRWTEARRLADALGDTLVAVCIAVAAARRTQRGHPPVRR